VAAPWIAIKLFERLNYPRSYRVKVYIPDKGQKVIVFIAENGFIAILKKMARALMPIIVILSIPG